RLHPTSRKVQTTLTTPCWGLRCFQSAQKTRGVADLSFQRPLQARLAVATTTQSGPIAKRAARHTTAKDTFPPAPTLGQPETPWPGFPVNNSVFPAVFRTMPVICAEPDFASWANTPCPSTASNAPLFPVPASNRPSEPSPKV